jgi:anti-sigma-K factor RskA
LNLNEIISSGLLESYVLGTCSAEETAMIQKLYREHPEVLREIESIEEGLMNFSTRLSKPLDPGLKEKIASKISFAEEKTTAKIISIEKESSLKLYQFGIAACLLLFVTSLVYNIQLNQRLKQVNGELAELSASKSYLADELKIQQASLSSMNNELQILANPMVKTIALKGMNMLDKKSAMVHMNMETHEVYFNASSLPMSPEQKQYQLWAIVDGKPVDAGMIDMTNTAQVFQKMKSIKGAQAFAVTIEKMGGSPVPTMETMCLLGNV